MQLFVRKSLLRALIVSGLATAPVFSGLAMAEGISGAQQLAAMAHTQQYDISAGPLGQVLSEFAGQAGILLSADAKVTEGKTSAGLSGQYSVTEALNLLLADTGLAFNMDGNTVTLAPVTAEVLKLSTVEVARSISADKLNGTGTSIGISKERLDIIKPRSLKDVFSGESSVSVGGNSPINQKLYVRGIEETALAVSIDGARQNNKIFHHNATTLIDPALLKSVRASAGVAAADDGPGAIGGSAVFETVDVADLLEPDDSFGGFVTAGYDTNAKTFFNSLAGYTQQDGFEILGFINRAAGDDYKDGNGERVSFSEADLLSGWRKVAYEADSGDRFELSFERVNDDSARPYRANFAGLTAGRPVPESRRYDLERNNIVFNYSNQQDEGLWNPRLVVAHSETDLTTTEVPLAAPGTTVTYNGVTRSQSIVAENLFITDFAEITAGADFYNDRATFTESGASHFERVKNTGVFVQFRQALNDVLMLSYGARYDWQNFRGTDGSKQNDSGVSGNVSADWAVTDFLTLKAGYARVWGGVALAENFIQNPAWDYSGGIKPIKSNNGVLGFESTINSFRFGANYYKTQIDDARVPSYSGGPGLLADFDVNGHDVFAGFYSGRDELTIKYSDITTKRDGSIVDAFNGNYFTVPLGEMISVSGTKFFSDQKLLMGLTLEHALENDNLSTISTIDKLESYTVINVFAEHEPIEGLTLRLTVNNLTDEDYADRATYGQEFATVNTLLEPGRSFLLSARYEF